MFIKEIKYLKQNKIKIPNIYNKKIKISI